MRRTIQHSNTVLITDLMTGQVIGRQLAVVADLSMPGVDTKVLPSIEEAKNWLLKQKHRPPFVINLMWPERSLFNDDDKAWQQAIKEISYLIWHLKSHLSLCMPKILIMAISPCETIEAEMLKHRPFGDERERAFDEFIRMGLGTAAVESILSYWANAFDASSRQPT